MGDNKLFHLFLSIGKVSKNKYKDLLKEIRQLVVQARHNVIRNINPELLLTYWNVGWLIVTEEHSGLYDETSIRNMLLDISKELARDLGQVKVIVEGLINHFHSPISADDVIQNLGGSANRREEKTGYIILTIINTGVIV